MARITPGKLRKERKAKGYTLAALAQRWGYSERMVGAWERGEGDIPDWVRDALAALPVRKKPPRKR